MQFKLESKEKQNALVVAGGNKEMFCAPFTICTVKECFQFHITDHARALECI